MLENLGSETKTLDASSEVFKPYFMCLLVAKNYVDIILK